MRERKIDKLTTFSLLILMLAPVVQPAFASGLPESAKRAFEVKFKKSKAVVTGLDEKQLGTVLVVAKDGIRAAGDAIAGGLIAVYQPVKIGIRNGELEYSKRRIDPDDLDLQVADLVGIYDLKFHDDSIEIGIRSLGPHRALVPTSIYFKSRAKIGVSSMLRFYFDRELLTAGELQKIYGTIEEWLKPFESLDEAVAFSKQLTAPREIKIGMSISEVEATLGAPLTILRLSDKTVYKYKDLAVEFTNGKVSDIKY